MDDTSMLKLLFSETISSAPSGRLASSKRRMVATEFLAGTIHLQVATFTGSDSKAYLHWPATNLAVFDVRLTASGQIEQDRHRLRTKRATDRALG
jgi:hypothetical protein